MLTVDGLGPALDLGALGLTDAQRAALDVHHHVVVSAGAGSGKTHTLAWRFVRLLLERARSGGDDVECVLVLTFTEKAAEEMAERCHQRLGRVVAWARQIAGDHPVTRRLERMLDRFDQARIHTFHGFCARLLREFPTSAGVPADLEVLEPTEADALRAQAADDALTAWVDRHDPHLGTLLDAFGSRRNLLGALQITLDRHGELRDRLHAHAADRIRRPDTTESTAQARLWLQSTGLPAIAAIERLTRPGGTRFWASLGRCLGPLPDDDPSLHQRLQDVLGALIDTRGGLRSLGHPSVVGRRADWPDARRHAQAKAALEALTERLADWPDRWERAQQLPTRADDRLIQALIPFARLALQARALHEASLRDLRALDFDAMQDRAVDAVFGDPALKQVLRGRHRWLMVDEFQDTDPRQWAMVKALGDAEPGEAPDRVFLVGDVKQAIYGFRGGDVALFDEAARHLGTTPKELPDNFRSRPDLIAWFNVMFPAVIPEIWSELAARRDAVGGSVTWIDADDVQQQAEATAELLRVALDDGSLGDLRSPAEPPVAILLRTRTHLGCGRRR